MTVINWSHQHSADYLTVPHANDDKYQRGVLGVRTGSSAYPGAAVLSVEAAWRTGVGLVRFAPPLGDRAPRLGLPSPAAAVLAARPETVFIDEHLETHRCDAWVLGSGTDPSQRSFAETAQLHQLLSQDAPVVVDAGALELLLDGPRAAPIIATPHRGEFLTLWRKAGLDAKPAGWPDDRRTAPDIDALSAAAAHLSATLSVAVLLKGSMTVVAAPTGFVAVTGPATPWLSTAGTGDVLAGTIGALIAAHAAALPRGDLFETLQKLCELGATAAMLHDVAARLAAGIDPGHSSGRPITALDVAHALPAGIAQLSTSGGASPARASSLR